MTLLADILDEVTAPVKLVNGRRLPDQRGVTASGPPPTASQMFIKRSRPVLVTPQTPPMTGRARPGPRKTAQTQVLFENPLDGDIFDELSDNEEEGVIFKAPDPIVDAPPAYRCNCPSETCTFPTHTADEIPITINKHGQHIATINNISYRVTIPIPPLPNARPIYINDAGRTVLNIDGFEYHIVLPGASSSNPGRPVSYNYNGDKIIRIDGVEYPVLLPGERMKPLPVVHNEGANLLTPRQQFLVSPFMDKPIVQTCTGIGWKSPQDSEEKPVTVQQTVKAEKRKAADMAKEEVSPQKKRVGAATALSSAPKRGRPTPKPKVQVNKWIAGVQRSH